MAEIDVLTYGAAKSYTDKHGGGGGTSNYNALENKPQIGGNELVGNKSASDLGLVAAENGKSLSTNDYDNAEKQKNADNATAVSTIKGDIASNFDATASYAVDDYVLKDGVLYKCTTAHTGAWDANDFTATTISDEIADVADAVDDIKDGTDIDSFADVETALAGKQDTLTFDNAPTENSNNPVKSGGVYSALAGKQGTLTAGDYISLNDGNIAVNRNIVRDNYAYNIKFSGDNDLTVTKSQGGTVISTTQYTYEYGSGGGVTYTIDDAFTLETIYYGGQYFKYTALRDSTTHSAGYTWEVNARDTSTDVTEYFPSEDLSGYKLVIKSEMDSAINAAVSSAYHHAGTKTCAELVAGLLVAGNEGNVYNMTDSGTTTADFIEGAGQPIKAGDNVGIAKISDGVYKFDLLSGFVDTSNFVQKSETAGLLKNDGTVDTTIQGDVSTLKSGLTNLDNEVNGDATVYPYADVITIPDAVPANVADCNVKIEPDQNLHGYDKPWVGGAGKNKLPLVLDDIKVANTTGTWNGNVYTINGGTITVNTDSDGNVVSVNANGTFSAVISFILWTKAGTPYPFESTSYTMNGCSGGSGSTYKQDVFYRKSGVDNVLLTALNGDATADFSVLNDETVSVVAARIVIYAGTLTNQMFYPMLRESTETDATFAPYTNICPITGHTEASVQRDGVNLLDPTANDVYATITQLSNGVRFQSPAVTGTRFIRSENPVLLKANTMYYFSCGNLPSNLGVSLRDYSLGTIYGSFNGSYTPTTDIVAYLCYRLTDSESAIDAIITPQVELGSTATPYEPYQGKTYTIALGDTIYGGNVDFDSGVMTVTHTLYQIASSSDINKNVSEWPTREFVTASAVGKPNSAVISNMYDSIPSSSQNVGCYVSKSGKLRINTSSEYSSKDDVFNNELKDATFYIELITPTIIQLTPQQIQLLKGTNTITASTGQISVTVNGVSGAIGSVQEQVNELSENVGGANLKILKYTGTGTTSYTLDFGDDTPATILQIVPEPGESVITNNYEYLSGFAWGVPFTYGIWANKSNNLPSNHGGFNISQITYSGNTCTITGPSASAAANYEGQKYAVYYLA